MKELIDDNRGDGALQQAARATHEQSQQAVSAVPVGIANAGRPAWWRCYSSTTALFSAGVFYEALRYTDDARPIVINELDGFSTLPVAGAILVPHDPWASYRAAQGTSAGTDETGTGSGLQPAGPVGATDAPETGSTHPHGGHNEGTH